MRGPPFSGAATDFMGRRMFYLLGSLTGSTVIASVYETVATLPPKTHRLIACARSLTDDGRKSIVPHPFPARTGRVQIEFWPSRRRLGVDRPHLAEREPT